MSVAEFRQTAVKAMNELERQVFVCQRLINTDYTLSVVIEPQGKNETVTLDNEVMTCIQELLTHYYKKRLNTAKAELIDIIVNAVSQIKEIEG